MLSALGLEERAVQMAAECETLREERDAIAAALDFVNDEMERLRDAAAAAEEEHARRRERRITRGTPRGSWRRDEGEEGARKAFGEEGFGEGCARVEGAPPPSSTKTKSTVASRSRDAFESMSSAKGSTTRGSPAALTPVPLSTRAPALRPRARRRYRGSARETTTGDVHARVRESRRGRVAGDVGHPGAAGRTPRVGTRARWETRWEGCSF